MAQDPPHVMYANDSFVHNTGNKILSLQYFPLDIIKNIHSIRFILLDVCDSQNRGTINKICYKKIKNKK